MQSSQDLEQNSTPQSGRYAIEQIFDTHLTLMVTDIQAWADLLAEEIVVEFPYAAALGAPTRLAGKSAVYNHVKGAFDRMPNLTFSNVRKYPTLNPNVLWAEFHGEAVIPATGRLYQQDYVVLLETKDRKAIHYREYWNPTAVINAWGNLPNFSAE